MIDVPATAQETGKAARVMEVAIRVSQAAGHRDRCPGGVIRLYSMAAPAAGSSAGLRDNPKIGLPEDTVTRRVGVPVLQPYRWHVAGWSVTTRNPAIHLLLIIAFLAAIGAGIVAAAAPRTLYWRALEVSAHLDRDGRLQVRERHSMVFDGAWNGGERRFRLERGQQLKLTGVARIDAVSGLPVELRAGGLSAIDEYSWADRHTLRWRSRLPSDPAFRNTELVYEIRYELSNILLPRDGGYVLDHDFAFPDRPGPIQHFTLRFDWDPAWQSRADFGGELARRNLSPGQSVVVTLPFTYTAAGVPAAVTLPVAPRWRYLLLAALLVFVVWRGQLWLRHEQQLGRFATRIPLSKIDEPWLAEHVFKVAPEVVGAAWDKRTAAPEVVAVLARMTAEGKLASEVQHAGFWWWRRSILHLELRCDRSQLGGYERSLIDTLFFDGDTTDTDRIRAHYRNRGFDPARKIAVVLDQRIKALAKRGNRLPEPRARPTLLLFGGAVPLLAIGMLQQVFGDPVQVQIGLIATVIVVGVWLISRLRALFYDNYIEHLVWVSAGMLAGTVGLVGALGYLLVTNAFELNLWLLTGLTVLVAAAATSQFNSLQSRDSREFIRFRIELASARRYFLRELDRSAPRLRDAWFPYLLAFGLGPNVDRWFRAYGSAASVSDFGHGGGGGNTSTGGWSGGGGSFGGAGASASWVAAAAGVAAGVPAPSSGGGSGGGVGGGGGGSSGGGGGGGW